MSQLRPPAAASRNIVVLLCDQLRRDFLSFHGCQAMALPNLDRIAAMGVTHDRAIAASPVCGPCRACLMTGERIARHGVWTNDMPFNPGVDFIAERMNALGYRTAAFGKMHHTPSEDAKGFQQWHGMEEGRMGDRDHYLRWLRERHPEAAGVFNLQGRAFAYEDADYYETWIADRAIDWLKKAPAEQPFFAWVSFQGPHGPHDPPPGVLGTVDGSKLPPPVPADGLADVGTVDAHRRALFGTDDLSPEEVRAMRVAYAESLVAIDREIGRILDTLERSGQLENTTILFSADHGDMLGDGARNEKGPQPWQAQLAVPLILANHPGIPAGGRNEWLCSNLDIPGTVLDVAGDARPIGQSRSLLSLRERPRKQVFSEFCDSMKLIETEDYRFCYYPFTGDRGLFRCVNGQWDESINLAGQPDYAAVEVELLAALIDEMLAAKGPRIEAQDCNPQVQAGLGAINPDWLQTFPVAFPVTGAERRRRLRAAGLADDYDAVFVDAPVLTNYTDK